MKQQFLRRALGGALSIGLLMQPALAAVTTDHSPRAGPPFFRRGGGGLVHPLRVHPEQPGGHQRL